MDPEQTLKDAADAAADCRWDDARDALATYWEWRDRGGFQPALGDERAAYLRAELEEIEEEAQREARAEERDPDARLEARLDAKALSDAADRVRLAGYDDDGGYEDASYDERDADFVRSLDDEEEG